MKYHIRKVEEKDRRELTDIINYYIENSYAAYRETKVGTELFDGLLALAKGFPFYVAETEDYQTVGFGLLHLYHGAETFTRTAEITYFISQEHTHAGIGRAFLDTLTSDARNIGIDTILASISSLNEQSLRFHEKYGFVECGRFRRIGRKWGKDFDMVWMQKFI